MKITIAPSEDQSCQKFPYYSVAIEFPHDDMMTAERMAAMFYQALLGCGYGPEEAKKAMNEFIP